MFQLFVGVFFQRFENKFLILVSADFHGVDFGGRRSDHGHHFFLVHRGGTLWAHQIDAFAFMFFLLWVEMGGNDELCVS